MSSTSSILDAHIETKLEKIFFRFLENHLDAKLQQIVEHKLNKILEPKPKHTSPIERKLMIVNKCYGKFKYSQQAIDEFNQINRRLNPHAKIKTDDDGLRNNPLMIKIVKIYDLMPNV